MLFTFSRHLTVHGSGLLADNSKFDCLCCLKPCTPALVLGNCSELRRRALQAATWANLSEQRMTSNSCFCWSIKIPRVPRVPGSKVPRVPRFLRAPKDSKGPQRVPKGFKGSQRIPKGPKGLQKGSKGFQRFPRGCPCRSVRHDALHKSHAVDESVESERRI